MPANVLFVDDEPDLELLLLRKFRRQIREEKLSFEFARNGAEALEKLRADSSIAIVFSDINMPVMDGLTLLTRLEQIGRPVKTVIVSAYDDMSNIRTAMNRGAFDFLTKPIDFQDFETTLAKTICAAEETRQSEFRRVQLQDLQSELAIAGRIQRGILPAGFPDDPRYEIYASMLPARIVGGDFYDFLVLDAGRVFFVMGDVSGKGVPAAIFMAMCRTLLRTLIPRLESPRACLLEMNRALLRDGHSGMFVTLCVGEFDADSGDVHFCVAGQTPPYVLQGDRPARRIDAGGNMIGIFDEPEIETGRCRLNPGDTLFLYTDGVPDAEDGEGNPYSQKRLATVLNASAGHAHAVVQAVIGAVAEFSGGAPQADDVTAMAIRRLV